MATVVVAFDAVRSSSTSGDAEATTNWGNIGGGGGISVEQDIVYQGSGAASRKVSGTELGRDWTKPSQAFNMTSTDRTTWLVKVFCTNYGQLNARGSTGFKLRIGNSSTVYWDYYYHGNDTWPASGEWQIVGLDPNVTGYRDNTGGSGHSLTAIDYFGILARFGSTAKAENIMIDSIDIGAGMTLTNGDGASADGVFNDFVTADEGSQTSGRYGFVTTKSGGIFVNGRLAIGENSTGTAVITEFVDADQVLIWNNGYFATGWAELKLNAGNGSTSIDIQRCVFKSDGEDNNAFDRSYTTTEDTRTNLTCTGTSGAIVLTSCNFQNFSDVTLTSACELYSCDVSCETLTQGTAIIEDCTIRTQSAASTATCTDPTFGTTTGIHDTVFVGNDTGHALQLSTATSYTLTNIDFSSGYGADTSTSAAIYCSASTGTYTLNWSGGSAPTYRKEAGATVNVVNSVTAKVTALDASDPTTAVNGARVLVLADSGGPLPHDGDTVTSITRVTTTATVTMTAHGIPSTGSWSVRVIGAAEGEEAYDGIHAVTYLTANTFSYTVSGSPTTPATSPGNIQIAGVILNGTTNASGIIQDTGYPFASDQPVTGYARKSTTSPLYQQSPILGTITSAGLDVNTYMVSDE